MFRVDENYLNRLSVDQLRAEVHDYAGRWIELIEVMRILPEVPSPQMLHVLGDFATRDDHERGKAMQRQFKLDAIPPVSECEGGAGFWSVVRAALLEVRQKPVG